MVGVPPFAPIVNLGTSPAAPCTVTPSNPCPVVSPWVDVADPYGSQGTTSLFPAQFGPINPTASTAIFPTSGISFSQIFDRHFRLPMVLAWNLTAEHAFDRTGCCELPMWATTDIISAARETRESGLLQLNPNHWVPVLQQEVPLYPLYGSIGSINSGVDSNYNAGHVAVVLGAAVGVATPGWMAMY